MNAAGPHEGEALGDAIGIFLIARRLRALDEAKRPLVDVVEVGIAATCEGAQQIQRRRRLAISHLLALRIGDARFRREIHAVDDVTPVGRQFDAADGLGRLGTRLSKLAGDTADLHHRLGSAIGQHHRHLQEDAEEVADIVGAVLGEALGTVAALQQKGFTSRHLGKRLLELARLAGKNQRRIARNMRLDGGKRRHVGIVGHLLDGQGTPGVGLPGGGHDAALLLDASPRGNHRGAVRIWRLVHEAPVRHHHQCATRSGTVRKAVVPFHPSAPRPEAGGHGAANAKTPPFGGARSRAGPVSQTAAEPATPKRHATHKSP